MTAVELRGRVVTPTGVVEDGLVRLAEGRIAAVERAGRAGGAGADGGEDSGDDAGWILPGFVDLHVHGGGGHTMTGGDPDETRAAAAFHARHGTTTTLASLVTAPLDRLATAIAKLDPLVADGTIAGVHVEGPYLSAARCGAQNPNYLRDPDTDELAALLDAGTVRMVTIAPELPGALAAIRLLHHRGIIAAIGHTDATYEQTLAGVEAGASVGTHLGNGMRPIHHRDPGPVVALLDAGVVCELIADGVHLHDGMLRHAIRSAGPDRVALITDAMAAAGMPDGRYELGGQEVHVVDRVARLAIDGAFAGSTLTMDAALRRTVRSGVSIVDAARMAATTPARLLGLHDELGAIEPGRRADLVLLDAQLRVTGVLRGGQPVPR